MAPTQILLSNFFREASYLLFQLGTEIEWLGFAQNVLQKPQKY